MADSTKILDGFYKGIPIRIDLSNVVGGRKKSKKSFPNRDTQTIQDFGLRPRTYTLRIVVAPLTRLADGATDIQQSYFEYRDSLIAAIESEESGPLIHPLYGRIDDVVAADFTIDEDFTRFGDTTITVTFEIDNNTGIPARTQTTSSQLAQGNAEVVAAVEASIEADFEVNTGFSGNFTDATDKVDAIADAVDSGTSFIVPVTIDREQLAAAISDVLTGVNELVLDPVQLASEISRMFAEIDNAFTVAEANARAFASLFGFGDNDDQEISQTTASRIERSRNRLILNTTVNVLALSYSYVNASLIDFNNVREIDETAGALEDQYQSIIARSSDLPRATEPVISKLTDLRTTTQEFLDERRLTVARIITIETSETPLRVLAYQYYGNTDNVDEIISLNSIDDPTLVSGSLEIPTA